MKHEVLEIHEACASNKYLRTNDAADLRNGRMLPTEFITKWYSSFDCIGQSKLLLVQSRHSCLTAVNVVDMVGRLKTSKHKPENAHKRRTRPQTAPSMPLTKKASPSLHERLCQPKKLRKSIDESDNQYAMFMKSLRSD